MSKSKTLESVGPVEGIIGTIGERPGGVRSVLDQIVQDGARKMLQAALEEEVAAFLAFYDFPAEHWKHLRTTNPIESTFSTIRLRHRRTKGSGTRRTSLAMMFKLAQAAAKRWRRLDGHEHFPAILAGQLFVNGIKQVAA